MFDGDGRVSKWDDFIWFDHFDPWPNRDTVFVKCQVINASIKLVTVPTRQMKASIWPSNHIYLTRPSSLSIERTDGPQRPRLRSARGKNQISKHDTFASRCRYVIVLMIYCHFGVCSTISVKRTVFEIYDFKNVVTLKIGLGARQGHWKYHHSIQHIRLPIDVLYNYGSNSCRFWDIQCLKMSWPWNRGQRSLKVIQSGIIR